MKKGSLELTSRQIVMLILVIIILAVVLILVFGYYDQLRGTWIALGGEGEKIGYSAVT
jgi:cell division protein FtsW (lipid II flippase)